MFETLPSMRASQPVRFAGWVGIMLAAGSCHHVWRAGGARLNGIRGKEQGAARAIY